VRDAFLFSYLRLLCQTVDACQPFTLGQRPVFSPAVWALNGRVTPPKSA
jgi:hypothetical protein